MGNLLTYEQPTKYIVRSDKYTRTGVPVLTAGKTFILGYTREKSGIRFSSNDKPVLIFDDFTTAIHFINFNFKIKSSAIKLLSNKLDDDNLFFNYLLIKSLNFEPNAHERHWISKFSIFKIKVPKFTEKLKISSLFSNLDSLITLHQRKLILLKNTKNRLLEKMFCDEK
ncbi:restriction endonuclease subunit S, partial [Metamycoplasma auris]|uniref:restriction endonuclease subunit S n=1 Tax=Metamycoplasma auris TaxID=51363 RepID=UPI001B7FFDF2